MKKNQKKTQAKASLNTTSAVNNLDAQQLQVATREERKQKFHVTRYKIPVIEDYFDMLKRKGLMDSNNRIVHDKQVDLKPIERFSVVAQAITDVSMLCYFVAEDMLYEGSGVDDVDFIYYNNKTKKVIFVHKHRCSEFKKY